MLTVSAFFTQGRRCKGDCQITTTRRTCSRASVSRTTEDRVSARKEASKGISQGCHSEEKIKICLRSESTSRQHKG